VRKNISNKFLQPLKWLLRVFAVFLLVWWLSFLVSICEALNGASVGLLGWVKLFLFVSFFCIPIYLSSISLNRRFSWILLPVLLVFLIFNFVVIAGKHYYINIIGIASSIMASFLLFKGQVRAEG